MQCKKGISQEMLKLIACVTMLVDHIGAVVLPQFVWLRTVGRVAFPIYCFLLAEGVFYTRNPMKYGFRLLIGTLLSEIPFDLALFGGFTWQHQSVMVTLLLAFAAAVSMRWVKNSLYRALVMIPFALMAELLGTDYGGFGIIMVGLFVLTREMQNRAVIQTAGLIIICWLMNSMKIPVFGLPVPVELFAVAAMLPICLYSGHKTSASSYIQWGFYLFYPLHLVLIWLIA